MKESDGLSVKTNIFCLTISMLIGFTYLWIQNGIVNLDYYEAGKVFALSVLLLVVPDTIYNLLKNRFSSFTISSITVFLILTLSVLGLICKNLTLSLAEPIAIIAILSVIWYLLKGRLTLKQLIFGLVGGIVFGLIFGIFIYGIDFLSPLFLEKVLYLGRISQDSLTHISIANIFNTYNVPSTGLDGIPYINYHWGSHLILSSFSSLLCINIFTFYNLAFPVIFIPLYFKAMILLVQRMRKFKNFNIELNWLFYALLIVAHYRLFYNPQTGFTPATPFNSEPYLIGIVIVFLITDIILGDLIINGKFGRVSLFTLPVAILVISSMKISLGFLFISAVFYLFFRYKYYRKWEFCIYLFLLGIIFIFSFAVFTAAGKESFNIWRTLEVLKWLSVYYLPYYLLLLLLIFLILIFDLKDDFKRKIYSRKYIDLEVLVFISFIGFIPGLVWYMDGNRYNFTDFQYWLSVILFLAYIPYFHEKTSLFAQDRKVFKILKVFVLLIFLNIFARTINNTGKIFISILKDKRQIIEASTGDTISELDKQFLLNLSNLSNLSRSEKIESCVFINNPDVVFQDIDRSKNVSLVFLVPAITGICSIEGIPPGITRTDFSFSFYGSEKSANINELIERARTFGFKILFEISNDSLSQNSCITRIPLI